MFNLDPGKYKVEFVAEDASLKEMSREGVKKYLTSTLQTLKGQSSYFDVKYKKEIEAELSNIENDINENPKLK
jgi:translation elongation factor EF-Ts